MATQLSALFERAVIYSMRAKEQAKGSKEQEKSLDTGADFIIDWFKKGEQGGFKAIGRTASAEVGRMLSDTDLLFLTWNGVLSLRRNSRVRIGLVRAEVEAVCRPEHWSTLPKVECRSKV